MALSESLLCELANGTLTSDQVKSVREILTYLDDGGYLESIVKYAGKLSAPKFLSLCASVCLQAIEAPVTIDQQERGRLAKDSLARVVRSLGQSSKVISATLHHRGLGRISHEVATALLAHQPGYTHSKHGHFGSPAAHGQAGLLELENPLLTKHGTLRQVHQTALRGALERLERSKNGYRALAVKRLATVLSPLVGKKYVNALLEGKLTDESLRWLTLGSWAQLALHTSGLAPLFASELLMWSPQSYWLSGGRMDALLLVDCQGGPLSGRLRKRACEAIAARPKNLVELIRLLPDIGHEISLEVLDFKFQVGDALGDFAILEAAEIVAKPVAKHSLQVRRYLAKSNIAFRKARGLNRTPWDEPVIRRAQLWYVFCHQPVCVHEVTATGDERREIVEQWRAEKPTMLKESQLHRQSRRLVRLVDELQPSPQLSLGL